ncbi:MAG: PAS domain S-box protein [Candidatus Cloacimonetes bacterium]|nr:PAS domain S-box protein [Candidatus Cloacimonadota bacterium]
MNEIKTKIMIVEDEIIIAEDIKFALENSGYEVAGMVSTEEEIMPTCKATSPDLILMDIMLGGENDGIYYAGEIRKQYNIPVIFLTAYADDDTIARAKETSPYGYLLKPFEERELYASIETVLYRRKIEEALKKSEKRYRTLFEQSNDAVLICDFDGKINNVNFKTCSMLGFSFEQLIAMDLSRLITDENLINSLSKFNQVQELDKINFETKFKKRFGKKIDVVLNAKTIVSDEDTVQCIVRDVTEINKLGLEVDLLHQAIDQSKLAMVISDDKGNFIYANRSMSKFIGYAIGELLEMKISDLFLEDSNIEDDLEILFKGIELTGDYKVRCKNGKIGSINASISPIEDKIKKTSYYMIIIKDFS